MDSGAGGLREERRIITVLFADVVGSTAIAERLDPEDAREVVGATIALMVEQVDSLGGTVKDLAGDGVLALFGAPIAHEDDAERAVLCGLRIVAAVADQAIDVAEQWAVDDLSVRIGVETGRAVLGPVGGGSRVEYGATGDVVNTAARLQARAEPGSVLVGAATRDMVESRFAWGRTRSLRLKGKSNPVRATRADTYRPPRHRVAARARRTLVGRAPELALMRKQVPPAGDHGCVLVVVGAAGVGKSRLVEEARDLFDRAGSGTWLGAGALSYAVATPYLLYRNAMLGWLDVPLSAARGDVRAAVEARAADEPPARAEALRAMAPVLFGASEPGAGTEAAQERLFAAFETFVVELSRDGPVVLALEDLHWSDPTSRTLTLSLARRTTDRSLLMLLTTRPGSEATALVEAVTEQAGGRGVRMELGPLSREDDRALLGDLTGGAQLPPTVAERLLATADGNPFFLEEQVRSLQASGALQLDADGARYVGRTEPHLPATVERALIARIDRLADPERQVLLAASVLGLAFPEHLVDALTDGRSLEPLSRLVRDEFLAREPDGSYRFTHILVQEAAYATLLRRQRRLLHARVAAVLEGQYVGHEQELASTLARHLAGAGQVSRAVGYLVTSAREAAAKYANHEAAALARQALALLDEPATRSAQDRAAELELRRIEATATWALARYQEAIAAWREVVDLLPGADHLARARAVATIGQVLVDDHRYEEALAELETARQLIGQQPVTAEEIDVWLTVFTSMSSAYYWLADLERHVELLEQGSAIVEQHATAEQRLRYYRSARAALLRRDKFLVSDELAEIDRQLYLDTRAGDDAEARAWASFMHGFSRVWRRELTEAEELLAESLREAEALGSVLLRSRALTYLMVVARLRGDVDAAAAAVQDVRLAADEAGLPEYAALASSTEAWVAYRRGAWDTVGQQAGSALSTWHAMPNRYPLDWLAAFPLLAAALVSDDVATAAECAEVMLAESQQLLPQELSEPLRQGLTAVSDDDPSAASGHFTAAVEQARERGYL